MPARAADQHRAEHEQERKGGGAHAPQLTRRHARNGALRSVTADHVVARVRYDAVRRARASERGRPEPQRAARPRRSSTLPGAPWRGPAARRTPVLTGLAGAACEVSRSSNCAIARGTLSRPLREPNGQNGASRHRGPSAASIAMAARRAGGVRAVQRELVLVVGRDSLRELPVELEREVGRSRRWPTPRREGRRRRVDFAPTHSTSATVLRSPEGRRSGRRIISASSAGLLSLGSRPVRFRGSVEWVARTDSRVVGNFRRPYFRSLGKYQRRRSALSLAGPGGSGTRGKE